MTVAIITGANTGLGFETARGLLSKGFDVVITSRNPQKGLLAVERLQAEYPNRQVSTIELDLSQANSVDRFAAEFSNNHGTWDVLVNNAGAKVLQNFQTTDSGVEYHFGVNAVAHFALTADLMRFRSKAARVVSVSSIVARFAPSKLGPVGKPENYSPGASYSASKLSNLLFAMELSNRSIGTGLTSLAAHPGFARAEPYGPKSTTFFEAFLAQSAARGARPQIETASNLNLKSGTYLGPKVLELWGAPASAKFPRTCTSENLVANWDILEKLSGRKLLF